MRDDHRRGRRFLKAAMRGGLIAWSIFFAGQLASGAASTSTRTNAVAGHWDAVARKDGRSWRIGIDIPSAGAKTATVDFTDLNAYGVEFAATIVRGRIHLERKTSAAITAVDAVVDRGRMTGRLLWSGIEAPLAGVRGGFSPPMLTQEDVAFTSPGGGVTLAGTILSPAGAGGGPYPAVVCTHGSTSGDRQFAAYRSEGVFYARLGMAALIYDRRGSGKSTGDAATASMEDLADDAIAGVEFLKTKKNIRSDEIGVSGISQAGWINPLAASRSKDVAFVVVISASGINPMDQSIFNTENVLRRKGFADAVVAQSTALRKRLYASARSGELDPDLPGALEAVHLEPWFSSSSLPYPLPSTTASAGERQFLMFEPIPVWEKVSVPVLGLWGGADIEVPAALSREIVERALAKSGHHDHTLVLYPAADHGLKLVGESNAAWDFPRNVPGARLLISEWVREHVHPSSRALAGVAEWTPS